MTTINTPAPVESIFPFGIPVDASGNTVPINSIPKKAVGMLLSAKEVSYDEAVAAIAKNKFIGVLVSCTEEIAYSARMLPLNLENLQALTNVLSELPSGPERWEPQHPIDGVKLYEVESGARLSGNDGAFNADGRLQTDALLPSAGFGMLPIIQPHYMDCSFSHNLPTYADLKEKKSFPPRLANSTEYTKCTSEFLQEVAQDTYIGSLLSKYNIDVQSERFLGPDI